MDVFKPGAEFGRQYKHYIWVCVNNTPRSFEKCNESESVAVWQSLQRRVFERGLGNDTFVLTSGCLLGCKAQGTTVALYSDQPLKGDPIEHIRFFRNVTTADVDKVLDHLA